jgi:hypothetical protein
MFTFDPNTWGQQFTVMHTSPELALESVKQFLKEEAPHDYDESWKDVCINNLPRGYTVKRYEIGQILQTEIC